MLPWSGYDPAEQNPIRILRVIPPARLETVQLRMQAVKQSDDPPAGRRLVVHAPGHAGSDYRVIMGHRTGRSFIIGNIDLPFDEDDELTMTSLGMGDTPTHGVAGFRGTIDADGRAEAFVPVAFLQKLSGVSAIAVILEDAGDLPSACLSSLPLKLN